MKNLVKHREIEKRETKAAKIEWQMEMRETYGSAWTKRKACRIHKDGSRHMGRISKTAECVNN